MLKMEHMILSTAKNPSILQLILPTLVNTNAFAYARSQKIIFDHFHSLSLTENKSLLTMIKRQKMNLLLHLKH